MSARGRLLLAALMAIAGAGCGATPVVSRNVPLATLPASAVPYLPSSVKALSPKGLARETAVPALANELGTWGFVSGLERYFQGESRVLQVVDSRTLRFNRVRGASAFVRFVRGHSNVYLGSYPTVHGFTSRGRSGIVAVAQECACHLASPAYLGVVSQGGTVTWVEINGPGATRRRLEALIAQAP